MQPIKAGAEYLFRQIAHHFAFRITYMLRYSVLNHYIFAAPFTRYPNVSSRTLPID